MDAPANGAGAAPQPVGSGAGSSATAYRRHRPENTVLYQVVEANADAFFAHLDERDASLPRFVREEFEAYLGCGRLEGGFVRAKCTGCRHEYLVAFSCKRRGWCPSCGARRMVETAAHLLDNVLPRAPMRQWVVTFPWPLRLALAAHPEWLTRVLAIVTRALSSALVKRAGYRPGDGAQTGFVTFIQRFGSKLNLNVHLHLLALDGAYTFEHGKVHFHRARAPYPGELEVLLDTLIRRITRTLVRAGVLVEDSEQPFLDVALDSPLAQLSGAAVRYLIAVGPQAGRATMRLQEHAARDDTPAPSKPFTVARDGFSLNCAVACEAHERAKLERICRYMARPPIAEERLSVDGDGLVVLELNRAFRDGTTHVLFEPHDFIARLAALVPRPRAHLVRYHGLFAPRARHRRLVLPRSSAPPRAGADDDLPDAACIAPMSWMARLHRVWGIEIDRCPQCGGEVRVIATVTEPGVIARILESLRRREHVAPEPRGPPPLAA